MTLPSSGQISISQVNTELGNPTDTEISFSQIFDGRLQLPNSDGVNPLEASELYSGVESDIVLYFDSFQPKAAVEVSGFCWLTFYTEGLYDNGAEEGGGITFDGLEYTQLSAEFTRGMAYYISSLLFTVRVQQINSIVDLHNGTQDRLITLSVYSMNTTGTKGTLLKQASFLKEYNSAFNANDYIELNLLKSDAGTSGFYIETKAEHYTLPARSYLYSFENKLILKQNTVSVTIEGVSHNETNVVTPVSEADGSFQGSASYVATATDLIGSSGRITLQVDIFDGNLTEGTPAHTVSDTITSAGTLSVSWNHSHTSTYPSTLAHVRVRLLDLPV